jgi:hypothetical protein
MAVGRGRRPRTRASTQSERLPRGPPFHTAGRVSRPPAMVAKPGPGESFGWAVRSGLGLRRTAMGRPPDTSTPTLLGHSTTRRPWGTSARLGHPWQAWAPSLNGRHPWAPHTGHRTFLGIRRPSASGIPATRHPRDPEAWSAYQRPDAPRALDNLAPLGHPGVPGRPRWTAPLGSPHRAPDIPGPRHPQAPGISEPLEPGRRKRSCRGSAVTPLHAHDSCLSATPISPQRRVADGLGARRVSRETAGACYLRADLKN